MLAVLSVRCGFHIGRSCDTGVDKGRDAGRGGGAFFERLLDALRREEEIQDWAVAEPRVQCLL